MNPQEQQSSTTAIDNELFQMYAHYQLCRVKKGITDSSNAAEKRAIIQILEACQDINANTFHTLVNDLLKHSVQLEPGFDSGLAALFSNNANTPKLLPSASSALSSTPRMYAHAGKKRPNKDSQRAHTLHLAKRTAPPPPPSTTSYEPEFNQPYSPGQSESEDSDDEGPTIITPARKRARSESTTDSRQGSSISHSRGGKKYSLSDSSKRDLTHMSARPEETKQELFKRMKRITDSFRIEYSISEEGKTPIRSFKIHFTERFSPQSINNQCQTNFVAYQLGQIIEGEARIFSPKVQEENKRLYYSKGLGKTANTKLSEINKYCKSLARIVDDVGVYCLFMPEILPPTFYRRADEELFTTMVRRMNDKFPQFATIASIDENGNLYIADIEDVGEDEDEPMDGDMGEDVEETTDKDLDEAQDKDTEEEAVEKDVEEKAVNLNTEQAAEKDVEQEAVVRDAEQYPVVREAAQEALVRNAEQEAVDRVAEQEAVVRDAEQTTVISEPNQETMDRDTEQEAQKNAEQEVVEREAEQEEAIDKNTDQGAVVRDAEQEAVVREAAWDMGMNGDFNGQVVDKKIGEIVDQDAGEALGEDTSETMFEDTQLDIKAEVVECSADKSSETAQAVNDNTPGWYTF